MRQPDRQNRQQPQPAAPDPDLGAARCRGIARDAHGQQAAEQPCRIADEPVPEAEGSRRQRLEIDHRHDDCRHKVGQHHDRQQADATDRGQRQWIKRVVEHLAIERPQHEAAKKRHLAADRVVSDGGDNERQADAYETARQIGRKRQLLAARLRQVDAEAGNDEEHDHRRLAVEGEIIEAARQPFAEADRDQAVAQGKGRAMGDGHP